VNTVDVGFRSEHKLILIVLKAVLLATPALAASAPPRLSVSAGPEVAAAS
jgi:hypothetical protein